MPIDEHGIRADMWIDMNSPVGRNNPGQLYETGINRISEFVRRAMENTLKTSGIDAAFDQMTDWYNDVNPNYAALVREACPTTQERKGLVMDAIETSPKINIPPTLDTLVGTNEDPWLALRNFRKWADKWGCEPSRVTFKTLQPDGTYKQFTTKSKFFIGSKYILLLNKVPEQYAPGPASVNHIGIPTKSTMEAKYFPVSTNPYRFGEDEHRVMSMDAPIREVVRFQNLGANSPTGVRVAIESILEAERPTAIRRIPISNGRLLQTNVVLNLLHNTTAVLGVQTKSTKVDPLDVPDELSQSIWEGSRDDEEDKPKKKRPTASKKTRVEKVLAALDAGDDSVLDQAPDDEDTDTDAVVEDDGDDTDPLD